jgi:hypothetical protein
VANQLFHEGIITIWCRIWISTVNTGLWSIVVPSQERTRLKHIILGEITRLPCLIITVSEIHLLFSSSNPYYAVIITKEEVRGEVTKHYVVSRVRLAIFYVCNLTPLLFSRFLSTFYDLAHSLDPEKVDEKGQAAMRASSTSLENLKQCIHSWFMMLPRIPEGIPCMRVVNGKERNGKKSLKRPYHLEKPMWTQTRYFRIRFTETSNDRYYHQQLFAFEVLSDGYMRERTVLVSSSNRKKITGLMRSAVTFSMSFM